MADDGYKRYTEAARQGIKGEAHFESLIVSHAIPHRIARQNDLGSDFLCEWTCGDRATGILFSAQVKTTTTKYVTCERKSDFPSSKNLLVEYTLKGVKKADKRTINYWKGLGIPAFLFVIVEEISDSASALRCFHKRYTPLLDGHASLADEHGERSFYEVSSGARFLGFADPKKQRGGFARDLIVDYARLSYSKGEIVRLTKRQLGFWPLSRKGDDDTVQVFGEMVGWNREKIEETCRWTLDLLAKLKLNANS